MGVERASRVEDWGYSGRPRVRVVGGEGAQVVVGVVVVVVVMVVVALVVAPVAEGCGDGYGCVGVMVVVVV